MRFRVPKGFLRRRQISRKKFERCHHPPIQPTLRNIANRINNRCPSFFYTHPKSEHFQNETSVHRKQNHHISDERVSICRDLFFCCFFLGNWGVWGREKEEEKSQCSLTFLNCSESSSLRFQLLLKLLHGRHGLFSAVALLPPFPSSTAGADYGLGR